MKVISNEKTMKVGLFGTCNGSVWRDLFVKLLDPRYFSVFNPVVDDWTEDCIRIENEHKESDDYVVFVITPKLKGVYSIAEVVDLSHKRSGVLFCVLTEDEGKQFDTAMLKSVKAVEALLEANGVSVFSTLESMADALNLIGSHKWGV